MTKNTGLLVPAQRDARMDEFWENLDSGLTAPAPPPRNLDVGLSDVVRAVGAGGLELVSGIGELARQAENYGRQNDGKDQGDYLENARANLAKKLAPALDMVAGVGELAQSGADSLKAGMSVDAQEAMGRSLVSESPSGSITLGDGAGDIDVWAMKMAQGVGSLLPTLASGGLTGLAAKATIGRMVTASMIKRGAAQEVAEAVAAKTVSRLATGAATTTGLTGSVGTAGVNARDSVLAMSFDELRNSTTFRDTFLRIDRDQQTAHLSDSEKLQMAREETANLASQATMGDAKTWGAAAVGTLMGDTMLFKMLVGKGVGGGMLKGMAKGAAGEGVSEALEEGAQQYSVNEALNEVAGADIDPMKGVVSSAIEGGLIGVGVGGGTGGVGVLRGERGEVETEDHPARDAEPTPPTSDEQIEPQVTPEPEVPTATDQSPLGPSTSQYDELRDVPAYLRQGDTADRFRGMAESSEVQDALAGPSAPTVDELLSQAMTQQGTAEPGINQAVPAASKGSSEDTAAEQPPTPVASASPLEAIIGPLQTLRITRKGKPFASEKEAAMASRKGKEIPVPLNGGGFGVAEIAEVEQAQTAATTQPSAQQLDDINVADSSQPSGQPVESVSAETVLASSAPAGETSQLAPAIDTGYREVISANQPQVEVSHEPVTPVSAVGSERQGNQPGVGEPITTGAGPADRVSPGDPADQAPAASVPDGQQQNDQTLTTPASAGVVVSEPVAQVEAARAEVNTEPTQAQKEAGNYKKGHFKLHGFDIALENPKGSTRSGTAPDGKAWQSTMAHDYGYIKRTEGADGDHVDVFIGDQPESEQVYVVDQVDPKTGKFDEHKVMLGFADEAAARAGYLANYEPGWKGLGAIKAMPVTAFKRWLKEGDTTKPVSIAEPAKEPEREIAFSKQAMAQGDKPAKHLTRKEAELVTKMWFKQYRGAAGIDVQIHATQLELEQALGLDAEDGLIRRAAFDRDASSLHIAADTISNPSHLRQILRHEVLAHYGLANVLGSGAYSSLIYRVRNSRNEPSMKSVWDWVETNYAGEDIGVQAEEVIAHLAELEPSAWRRGWDKVVSWLTQALRKVGVLPEGRVNFAEIRSILEAVGSHLQRKGRGSLSPEMGYRFSAERTPWREGFPEVILHGRLGDATSHPDYEAAKGGDDAAARRLVHDVLSPDAIKQFKGLIGDRSAIALGVHAEEAVSRNAIPQAMADVLGKVLGIEVDLDIVQSAKVGRTAQDGFGRLANQPSFDGPVRTDKPYLIMDDTLTQGGTLANLKGYIEFRGGEVLAATALTGKQYSAKIAIDSSTLEQLRDQYDGTGLEAWWQNRFGYGFDSLTESEGRYLLRAKDADKVRDRVSAAGQTTPTRSEHESTRDDGSLPPDGLKFSQTNAATDEVLQKLNLGPKPDIIDKTKTNLDKLRKVERSVVESWVDRFIKKANTEVLDALAPIKYAEEAAGITDAADSGYVAARMATGAASTMQATMLYGLPEWKDGVIQRKAGTGEKDALLGIFSDLGADLHNCWAGWRVIGLSC
ncbi:hypothetical protein [Aeromonas salmonicida]|uniref:hypothetical protein n=1 Tax=Aeromonas salmonicida TaxID=645 RepID=UPI001EDE0F80|nr:hypothetical protein [Aeromonas salmonicida]